MSWGGGQQKRTPLKPSLRRWLWCRLHHDVIEKDLWSLVALTANSELAIVEAFVTRLEIHASSATPRGCLIEFNVKALAAKWRRDPEELARIYAALESPEVGWIDQDHVVTFWLRNPDHEDATAAERQRNKRLRDKAMKQAVREGVAPAPQSRDVTRDSVTVTTISDQIRDSSSEPIHSESGDRFQGSSEIWLTMEGRRIVCTRCVLVTTRAQFQISQWLKEIRFNHSALRQIILDADLFGLTGGRFTDRISAEIQRHLHETKGPSLPFPPAIVRKAGEG